MCFSAHGRTIAFYGVLGKPDWGCRRFPPQALKLVSIALATFFLIKYPRQVFFVMGFGRFFNMWNNLRAAGTICFAAECKNIIL